MIKVKIKHPNLYIGKNAKPLEVGKIIDLEDDLAKKLLKQGKAIKPDASPSEKELVVNPSSDDEVIAKYKESDEFKSLVDGEAMEQLKRVYTEVFKDDPDGRWGEKRIADEILKQLEPEGE